MGNSLQKKLHIQHLEAARYVFRNFIENFPKKKTNRKKDILERKGNEFIFKDRTDPKKISYRSKIVTHIEFSNPC